MQNTKTTILIVDDDCDLRRMLIEILSNESIRCIEAQDGMAALKVLDTEKVDLVFSDTNMPQMDGVNLLKTARNRWPTLPFVIFFSGYHQDRTINRDNLLEFGANWVLTKPYDLTKIWEVIAVHFSIYF